MANNSIQKAGSSELAIVNKEEFVRKFDPSSMMMEFRHVKSMTDAIQADNNSVAFYRKQFNEDTVLAVIEMHLLSLCTSLNVHEKLNELQIKEIALEIVTVYYHLSIVEIQHVFKRAKRGEFGRINYSINMPDVLSWFSKYAEERVQHFMNKADSVGTEMKQNAQDSSVINEQALEVLSEFKAKLDEKDKFDEEEYQKFKKNPEIHTVDTSENEDLQKKKKILEQQQKSEES